MSEKEEAIYAVKAIRHFSRYYTNRLGLLSRYRFDTPFTLTEARVLLEIGRRGEHTQSALRAELRIDLGYLNRVVKRLVSESLVDARPSQTDGRVLVLRLTAEGRHSLDAIEKASDAETEALLDGLKPGDIAELVGHLRAAERILEGRAARGPIIESVTEGPAVATVGVLIREYVAFLGVDLSFQALENELASLPGKYAPPTGALFLASVPRSRGGGEPAGCVALRKLEKGVCEMKRLFVRPEYRGFGVGKALAARIVLSARELGYERMRLDTLERLGEAVALYRSMGFHPIDPYCDNPLEGAVFLEKELNLPD
ncbi:MAG: helix-turn-helix domain-containing GNAT family N-acetyltransferase [Treponemataceae bacterium]